MKRYVLCAVFMLFMPIEAHDTLYRLLVKIPTRSRPEQLLNRLDIYYKKLSGDVAVTFLITADSDDITMNNQAVIDCLALYPNLYFYFSDNKSKIEAYNKDIDKHMDFDVLLVASDDMEPIVDGYDKIIIDRMLESFPDFDGVLNFHDGHLGAQLNTMPVLGKKYYERFGYIYHPAYISLWCDNELTQVSRMLRKECICNEVIILHKHPIWGLAKSDALYAYNQQFLGTDKITYEERKAQNFYLTN